MAQAANLQNRSAPCLGEVAARPFLKWAGGKRSVVPHLMPRIPTHFRTFHEPFVGGGALFFALRNEGCMQTAVLSDTNLRLVRTYRAVRDDVDGVIARLEELADNHGNEQYYAVRAWDVDAEGSDTAVAAWMIYLNKTGFNGLYRVNRKGGFNVPIGRYENPTICDADNLRACSTALAGVTIEHEDFTAVVDRAAPGDVVYFDPPYVPLSGTASFTAYTRAGFGPEDQQRLRDGAAQLKRRGVHVLLSNHDTDEVRELYAGQFEMLPIAVSRAINSKGSKRGRVGELVIW